MGSALESLAPSPWPELVIGVIAPVGTQLNIVLPAIEGQLRASNYYCETVIVSSLMGQPTTSIAEYDRVTLLMNRGDALRAAHGAEVCATLAAAEIQRRRALPAPAGSKQRAFIVQQLKNPDEVVLFRRIYGRRFVLLGVHSTRSTRIKHLMAVRQMTEEQAKELVTRDEAEAEKHGQQVRATFHLADAFVDMGADGASSSEVSQQVERFFNLLFAKPIVTPRKDEFGMYLAHAAALRSADLARQVGAAILTPEGEVVSVGMNDVPKAMGGLYWDGEKPDGRDFVKGFDANDREKREIVQQILDRIGPGGTGVEGEERKQRLEEALRSLEGTGVTSLTEFGRSVHAEMEALLAAARRGTAVRGCTLYTTTFPCHNCAKHIVAAGIAKVVYIEPYPKSKARDLHNDAISFSDDEVGASNRVAFLPFVGVAPRRYGELFSTVSAEGQNAKRKDSQGNLQREAQGVRNVESELAYLDREKIAAEKANSLRGELGLNGDGA